MRIFSSMKRTFLAKRNALISTSDVSWGAYALLAAIVILLVRLLAPNFFWSALAPIFQGAEVISSGSHAALSSFGDAATLAARNEQLTEVNTALVSANKALTQKTASLEELLGTPPDKDAQGVVAGIVTRPPVSPYDTLVLSGGSGQGVMTGEEAFGPGSVPLGVVTSVLADFSRVTLFSAPPMTVNGSVGHTGQPISIRGAGGGTLRASISRSAAVAVGDDVFAPGPGLLPIGTVVRIDSDPSSPSVTLQIQPAFNLFSLSWVQLRATGPAFVSSLSWATSTEL